MDIICLRESTSLVYTDMISPCEWVSKYLTGSFSIFEKSPSLIFLSVPWVT